MDALLTVISFKAIVVESEMFSSSIDLIPFFILGYDSCVLQFKTVFLIDFGYVY